MAKTEIVPFGRYKGQPVEALAQDKEYCEWLIAQDWFRPKFTAIHTLIINNFGVPDETPEHNALQAVSGRELRQVLRCVRGGRIRCSRGWIPMIYQDQCRRNQ